MATTDKKNFCISGTDFTLVRGARWYLEYYVHDRGIPERRRNYGGLNRIKDIKARELAAVALAESILCPVGGCILSDALDKSKPLQRLKTWQSQKARLKYYLEWWGLDMVNEYLKNLEVLDNADLRARFPSI